MSKLLSTAPLALVAALSLAACEPADADVSASQSEVVSAWLDALEAQDADAAAALMTDDVVWETRATLTGETAAEALERQVGKDEVVAFLSEISAAFESTRFSHRVLFESEDDLVFAELEGDFVLRGSGAPYRNLYMFKVTVDGDRVARIDEYFNPIHAAIVLGIDLCEGQGQ